MLFRSDHATFTVGSPGSMTVTTNQGFPVAALSKTGALPSGVTFADKLLYHDLMGLELPKAPATK